MNISFTNIFGYCIIPKNTLLYRGHKSAEPDNYMFFGLKRSVASVFDDQIQIWKTTNDMKVLFLVNYLDSRSWASSAIPKLYKTIFEDEGNNDISDVEIKQDRVRLTKLVEHLLGMNIYGWFSSLESKAELEVCLFGSEENANHLRLVEIIHKDSLPDKYFRDSLRQLKIFPSAYFIEETKNRLNSKSNYNKIKDPYKRYLHSYKLNVKEAPDMSLAKELHYDLRLKLKI